MMLLPSPDARVERCVVPCSPPCASRKLLLHQAPSPSRKETAPNRKVLKNPGTNLRGTTINNLPDARVNTVGCSPLAFLFAFADPGWDGHLQPPAPSQRSRAPATAPWRLRHPPPTSDPGIVPAAGDHGCELPQRARFYPPGTGTSPASEPTPAAFPLLVYICFYFKRRKSRLTHSPSVSRVLPPCLSFSLSPCS